MITNTINSIYELLGGELPEFFSFFYLSVNSRQLIALLLLIAFAYFVIALFSWVKSLVK